MPVYVDGLNIVGHVVRTMCSFRGRPANRSAAVRPALPSVSAAEPAATADPATTAAASSTAAVRSFASPPAQLGLGNLLGGASHGAFGVGGGGFPLLLALLGAGLALLLPLPGRQHRPPSRGSPLPLLISVLERPG